MSRDNQQVTLENIAWLAGIWDGEGTLSIVRQMRKSPREGHGNSVFGLNPKATMENTSEAIIEECCRILDGLDIKYYIQPRSDNNPSHKERYVLSICRLDMIEKFCNVLVEYLISKKDQCRLLKRYAISRLKHEKDIGRGPGRGGYSNNEVKIMEDIQVLNKLGPNGTSTTLRKTLDYQLKNKKRWLDDREKIKSELNGNIKNATEMIASCENRVTI